MYTTQAITPTPLQTTTNKIQNNKQQPPATLTTNIKKHKQTQANIIKQSQQINQT